ncbi:carboxypeptidase B-like isoform X2 [Bombyx mandarina]|uniref:Molting fluid carboxypeptidase A n=2 Tax=Bombyx TaxID=7090 RepID=Q60F93_BOMMO|nr:molting fluid carboxypeptidase A precursor [Bombyx mori]XP_028031656.1 carboxypeptidase B-like isoform X2 [Bombyx mandarina]BAD60916.1 molting fluid carboxypeptidase A [Bombyx mori]
MGSKRQTVVLFLAALTVVLSSPLINELQPGEEWPQRNSVRQPVADDQTEQTLTEDFSTDDPAPAAVVEDAIIVAKTIERDHEPKKIDYSGSQVWQVSTTKSGARQVIGRLRRRNLISTWGGNQSSVDILIKPNVVENITRVFKRESIDYNVVIEDLQKRINEENPPLDNDEIELQDRRGHRMTWKQYHRLEDIYGFMDYLAKTYPSIISVKSIGKSFEGRDLKILRISNGKSDNKAVFIDGGIHAREWISPATVTYFIYQFAEYFDVESDDIKGIDWYFMPVVNPDGYEYTHTVDRLWRKNRKPGYRACTGTDLNRNFGHHWGGKGASNSPCSEIYRGSNAFSEPETLALSEFIKSSAANFSAYVTYHSYGQYMLYPWGYDNAVPPDYKDLDNLGKKMAEAISKTGGSQYQVGSSSGLLYPAAGGSDDWAKSQGIKYSYTIELSDTGRYGFVLPTSFIVPVAKENLAGLRVLASQVIKE